MCLKLALFVAEAKELSKYYLHQHQSKTLTITSNLDEYVFSWGPKYWPLPVFKGRMHPSVLIHITTMPVCFFLKKPLSSSHLPIASKGSQAEQHIPVRSGSWISKVLALCLENTYGPGWNLSWIPADPFLPLKGSHLCPSQTITLRTICVPQP